MDHGGMDHGDMGHGGMDTGSGACKMSMLWNTDIEDTCIVFSWWHIRSYQHFFFSVLIILALGALYEYLRLHIRTTDARLAASLLSQYSNPNSETGNSHRRRASVVPPGGSARGTGPDGSVVVSGFGIGEGTSRRASPNPGQGYRDHDVLLSRGAGKGLRAVSAPIPRHLQLYRSLLYGASAFLSFFLMLVFMTYNAYLILATVSGAIIGHYFFNRDLVPAGPDGQPLALTDGKGMACH